MNGRRRTRSSQPSSDFENLLENLHAAAPENCENNSSAGLSTLAEASKHDVSKLLDRAGIRGATAKEQANKLPKNSSKRIKENSLLEGQASLFYQRKGRQNDLRLENSLICGTGASTLKDVMYGTSDGGAPVGNGSVEIVQDAAGMCLEDSEARIQTASEDASDNGAPMEEACEWEFGSSSIVYDQHDYKTWTGDISIEVDMGTPEKLQKKLRKCTSRRATAKDKEFADLVHKAHLLCLIARGRLVDAACDDPLLQASILSVIPSQFCEIENVAASDLEPVVKWFHKTFQISMEKASSSSFSSTSKEDLTSLLLNTLHMQAGSSEAVAALFVSLLRALGFTARYVTVLDVLPLKPNALSLEASADWEMPQNDMTSIVEDVLEYQYNTKNSALSLGQLLASCAPQSLSNIASNEVDPKNILPIGKNKRKEITKDSGKSGKLKESIEEVPHSLDCTIAQKSKKLKSSSSPGSIKDSQSIQTKEGERNNNKELDESEIQESKEKVKKKGDLEFELQLAMAMAATAGADCKPSILPDSEKDLVSSKLKRDIPQNESSRVNVGNTKAQSKCSSMMAGGTSNTTTGGGAIWSRKMGPLLHWAEVYFGGNGGGRWVHVDGGRGLLDAEGMVESAAASCKIPLCYVLAFSGTGAKDVTRRYVTLWSALTSLRVNSDWWNTTLAPLKELEAAATATSKLDIKSSSVSMTIAKQEKGVVCDDKSFNSFSLSQTFQANDRASLEDMELDIKEYTEPLPKNQQAYRNHHLYVLERWLTKYQALHPRGPILGYCAGHPVFPRSCVHTLHTAERWLREGCKVKSEETPVKIVKSSRLLNKQGPDPHEDNMMDGSSNEATTTSLFGKWQTEPWHPPAAIGGIVPKNERGNVELWSEKCLPSGTVHINLPRILPLAKKLEIDFAPAMVGYEIRNRKTVPVFEGVVVCKEYESLLLEAYVEAEHWRNVEIERRREEQAVARWCQLLRSVATRQRLQDTYQVSLSGSMIYNDNDNNVHNISTNSMFMESLRDETNHDIKPSDSVENTPHEHSYPEKNQSYDELTGIRTKTCPCGFVLTVEEM